MLNLLYKVFRFGNGMTQSSESLVCLNDLKQQVGNHEIKLGAYTIDATGVPLLLGIRTLERLGAVLDTKQRYLVLKTVDPTLIVPLKRSPTGHLLLDLCSNWLDGGAKILFQVPDRNFSHVGRGKSFQCGRLRWMLERC